RRARDVEVDDEKVVGLSDRPRNGIGVAAGCDDKMPGGEGGLGDVDAHATPRAGDEPNPLASHVPQPSRVPLWRHRRYWATVVGWASVRQRTLSGDGPRKGEGRRVLPNSRSIIGGRHARREGRPRACERVLDRWR